MTPRLCSAGDHIVRSSWCWRLVLPDGPTFVFCDRVCLIAWACDVLHEPSEAGCELPRIVNFRRRRPLGEALSLAPTGSDG